MSSLFGWGVVGGLASGALGVLGYQSYRNRDILTSHSHEGHIGHFQANIKIPRSSFWKVTYTDTPQSVLVFGHACAECGHISGNRIMEESEHINHMLNDHKDFNEVELWMTQDEVTKLKQKK